MQPNNGLLYNGGINSNGDKEGYGELIFPTGAVYKGYFKNDQFHGNGVYQWGDGNVYEGEFVEGRQEGIGVYYWPTGGKYYGYWKRDKMSGQGVYVRQDGVVYEGYWRQDHQFGAGIKRIPARIAAGSRKITTTPRIIKEYWDKNRQLLYHLEPFKIPKFPKNSFNDIIIVHDGSEGEIDQPKKQEIEEHLLMYLKNICSTNTTPKMKKKKTQPNLNLNNLGKVLKNKRKRQANELTNGRNTKKQKRKWN